jgi:hypothetical protein
VKKHIGIIVNFLRTPWELDGNIMGTRKNQKIYKSETVKGEERWGWCLKSADVKSSA